MREVVVMGAQSRFPKDPRENQREKSHKRKINIRQASLFFTLSSSALLGVIVDCDASLARPDPSGVQPWFERPGRRGLISGTPATASLA